MTGRVVGFDYGRRRIGIATGNPVTGSAQALNTLDVPTRGPDWRAIEGVVREWRPAQLVVGLPLHLDGAESPLCDEVRAFAETLEQRTGLPVALVDERLSSSEANHLLNASARPGKAKTRRAAEHRDSLAAELIVRTYLDQNRRPA